MALHPTLPNPPVSQKRGSGLLTSRRSAHPQREERRHRSLTALQGPIHRGSNHRGSLLANSSSFMSMASYDASAVSSRRNSAASSGETQTRLELLRSSHAMPLRSYGLTDPTSTPDLAVFHHHLECLARMHEALLLELRMATRVANKGTEEQDKEAGDETSCEQAKMPTKLPGSISETAVRNRVEALSSAADEPKVTKESRVATNSTDKDYCSTGSHCTNESQSTPTKSDCPHEAPKGEEHPDSGSCNDHSNGADLNSGQIGPPSRSPSFFGARSSEDAEDKVHQEYPSSQRRDTLLPNAARFSALEPPRTGSSVAFRSSLQSSKSLPRPDRNSNASCGSLHKMRSSGVANRFSESSEPILGSPSFNPVSTKVPVRANTFSTWPEWRLNQKESRWKPNQAGTLSSQTLTSLLSDTASESEAFGMVPTLRGKKDGKVVRALMIRPGSWTRLVWDLIGCFLLLFDAATLPFFATFEVEDSTFFEVAGWLLMLFWTFDMGLSFLTGYFNHGQLVLKRSSVAQRYLRTWFIPDAIIVALDWTMRVLTYTTNADEESSRLVRTMRIVRFGRALRLVRLLKITRVLHALQERIDSQSVSVVMDVLTYICFLLGSSHIVACIWYGVGKLGAEDMQNARSWLIEYNMAERSVAYRYFSSLHWTLSFFAASCDIYAISTGERVMTVVVLVLALVGFSSFLSVITSAVMTIVNTRNEIRRQFWMLRRYLRAKAISKSLALRVERYLDYINEVESRAVQDSDVVLLARLSEPLREELRFESFHAHLTPHPLFLVLNHDIKHFVHACHVICIGCKDMTFCVGQVAERMLMVSSGRMSYERVAHNDGAQSFTMSHAMSNSVEDRGPSLRPSSGNLENAISFATLNSRSQEWMRILSDQNFYPEEEIHVNEWVAEAVLWMPWTHLGNLVAEDACQLVAIESAGFREQISKQKAVWDRTQRYASTFVQTANTLNKTDLSDLVDREIRQRPELADVITDAEFLANSGLTKGNTGFGVMRMFSVRTTPKPSGSFSSSKSNPHDSNSES
mmetsp:Transcript_45274/g.79710  ORF Transcript_45274/g.79710 Transcript_45274/m.79710 type:complete len:1031 (-) Transcript_45274:51-3143(-)